ncbi:MAG TPA: class I SAM-dependent methyltransferase [Ktedonobacterales bacterium]|nr:class I SAM-dependent methyltransferase [Ktedonobacterales bacterium]
MAHTSTAVDTYSFDPFARHPFYTDLNRSLVRRALGRLDGIQPKGALVRIVEMASGTGAVTQLIADELARLGRPVSIIGIEPSDEAIAIARAQVQADGVRFIQGDADALAQVAGEADAVFLFNAIHLIADKPDALTKIARVLRPGSIFACNSAFFAGANPAEGEQFAHLWIRRALAWLRLHHPEVRATRRGQGATMAWLSADEYASLLALHGLPVVERSLEEVVMPLRAVQDIGRYWLFIEGALPGVPIPLAADALEWAAMAAAQELKITGVPRRWLQLVALRDESRQ